MSEEYRLFVVLIAPFWAGVVFLQSRQLLNSVRYQRVNWRGESRSRDDNPRVYWLLLLWNIALLVAVIYIYLNMVAKTLGSGE